ncbi:MAG TPA: MFS transporter [Anaerolineales bacterium]|nr:MFS transporter [Anaerolineales bacterium]HRF47612.1 MFS transporter [Anaerolineales bacterium]
MSSVARSERQSKLGVIILAYIAFIALGMPDGLLGVAWPTIRTGFGIPLDSLGALLIAATSGYMLSSFLSGRLIARFGVGQVLAASCALTGSILIGYTLVPNWWMMVSLGVGAGLGAGAIDAGLNTYVATHFGEGLMQWLHASYGIGVTLGPLIMTVALSSLSAWRPGYLTVAAFQLVLAASFLVTLPMWNQHAEPADTEQPKKLTEYKTSLRETLRQPRVWLSIGLFLIYAGAEVTLGVWAYTLLTESRGVDAAAAGLFTGSYWAMFTIGRAVAGLFTQRVGLDRLLLISLVGALVGAVMLWLAPLPWVNLAAVGLIGFAIAPVFPALVSDTSRRVGDRFAANTIGMQISGAGFGGALVPGLAGILARQFSLEAIPVWLVALYLVLLVLYIGLSRGRPQPV